jgi:hypothetical protein
MSISLCLFQGFVRGYEIIVFYGMGLLTMTTLLGGPGCYVGVCSPRTCHVRSSAKACPAWISLLVVTRLPASPPTFLAAPSQSSIPNHSPGQASDMSAFWKKFETVTNNGFLKLCCNGNTTQMLHLGAGTYVTPFSS